MIGIHPLMMCALNSRQLRPDTEVFDHRQIGLTAGWSIHRYRL